LIDFDPSVGAEIRKVRPAVVVSVDVVGDYRCDLLCQSPIGNLNTLDFNGS
jgi:mRNA-degrading endonuclease toxin of MazEF toxin-antitoxin module